MNNRRQDERRMGGTPCRRWFPSAALLVALGLLTTGCQSLDMPGKDAGGSFNPLYAVPVVGAKAKEDALRKRVEADPFPTATNAGL